MYLQINKQQIAHSFIRSFCFCLLRLLLCWLLSTVVAASAESPSVSFSVPRPPAPSLRVVWRYFVRCTAETIGCELRASLLFCASVVRECQRVVLTRGSGSPRARQRQGLCVRASFAFLDETYLLNLCLIEQIYKALLINSGRLRRWLVELRVSSVVLHPSPPLAATADSESICARRHRRVDLWQSAQIVDSN